MKLKEMFSNTDQKFGNFKFLPEYIENMYTQNETILLFFVFC